MPAASEPEAVPSEPEAVPSGPEAAAATALPRWLAIYAAPRVRRMLALGFSSGLPLPLVFGTLSFWLREAGVDRTTIGFVSWVALAYAFKWAWAPLVDQVLPPLLGSRLGRRRSWLLVAQVLVIAGLVAMARSDPAANLGALVGAALLTAFASATQDIALDAYRIESAPPDEQAALAAAYQAGYRLALIWAGAGALWIAAAADPAGGGYHASSWGAAYLAMAGSMSVGIVTVLRSPCEPFGHAANAPTSLADRVRVAVIGPFADFLRRYRWRAAALLALIATFRLPDIVMGVMANPLYFDIGFTKGEVAAVSKVFGVAMTLVGAFIGGAVAPRIGILPTLFVGAVGATGSSLLFAALARHGHDVAWLTLAVSADNLATGIGSSAFIAFLSSLTNIRYSATQYALFSSIMLLLPKYLAGFSGAYVERFGYVPFFCTTAVLGVPAWILIGYVGHSGRRGATAPG